MSALSSTLIFVSLVAFIAGQLFLKRAMQPGGDLFHLRSRNFQFFSAGLVSMTVSFFLTLGLLQHLELSYLYPFQGLSVLIISGAAVVVLREKLNLQLAVGVLLISAGIVLVSTS